MKKLSILLSLVFLLAFPAAAAAQSPDITVYVDGQELSFEVKPQVSSGTTLVPLRKIFEQFGADIVWDQKTKTVHAQLDDTSFSYTIGHKNYTVSGERKAIPVPGKVVDGHTLIPLRMVGEAFGYQVGWEKQSKTVTISTAPKMAVKVNRVIDGDTFEYSYFITRSINKSGSIGVPIPGTSETVTEVIRERVRLIGIDTPETVKPGHPVEHYGQEASDYLKELIEGEYVLLEFDVSERDRYGRVLAYVYLENGNFVNAMLVGEGYAKAVTYPPDVKWNEMFKELEKKAKTNELGLWKE